jgi:hypothetical protein
MKYASINGCREASIGYSVAAGARKHMARRIINQWRISVKAYVAKSGIVKMKALAKGEKHEKAKNVGAGEIAASWQWLMAINGGVNQWRMKDVASKHRIHGLQPHLQRIGENKWRNKYVKAMASKRRSLAIVASCACSLSASCVIVMWPMASRPQLCVSTKSRIVACIFLA